jgi:pilus assembly protein CpaF
MEIFEATGQQDGNVIGQTLYQYIITDNVYTDDLPEIKGYHKKIGNISSGLAHQLLDGGAPLSVVKRFAGNDFEPERR